MSSRQPRVAVLKGGWSAEREVSLVSGRECARGLREAGYEVVEIDAGRDVAQRLAALGPVTVFNALHGRWGEDGCVQGLLEVMGLPYTHSGVLASALAMDKPRAKAAFAAAGLPVAHGMLASRAEIEARHVLPPPYVVKPFNEGSSVGVVIVPEGADGPPILWPGAPETMMVEAFVPGRELTVAVMGDRPLCVTDIVAASGWYDYHAKYAEGGSRHVCPAGIPAPIADACLDMALRAHRAVGARGVSRADFRWDEAKGADGLAILEINTQPGMTPTSLAPEQAAAAGMSFPDLCRWIVEDASCRR
mgnify:CR=1 FL=1